MQSGALDLLMKAIPIVGFECDSAVLSETGSSPTILPLPAGCGYRTYRLDRRRTVPVRLAPTYHCDLIALKEPQCKLLSNDSSSQFGSTPPGIARPSCALVCQVTPSCSSLASCATLSTVNHRCGYTRDTHSCEFSIS